MKFKTTVTLIALLSILSSAFVGCGKAEPNKVELPQISMPDIPSSDAVIGNSHSTEDTTNSKEPIENTDVAIENIPKPDPSQEEKTPTPPTVGSSDVDLSSLSREKIGWGPGYANEGELQPLSCTLNNELYSKFNAVFSAPHSQNIYLTFDEGYENGYTSDILDTLKAKNVSAVFFITYDYAKRNHELVLRMIDEGHIVGNHSMYHPSFPTLDKETLESELMDLHNYVLENFNYTMTLFRPPMGEFSEYSLSLTSSLGYQSVFWSFAYLDYDVNNQPPPDEALSKLLKHAHGGEIMLLHAVSKTNTEILGQLIDTLQKDGYTIAKYDLG